MRQVTLLLTILILLAVPAHAFAGSKEDVAAATKAWVKAYNSGDPDQLLKLYDTKAVFWGTVSPTLRDTPQAIREYFKDMPKYPKARVALVDERIRVYGDIAINTGLYTFSDVTDGKPDIMKARFSFTYRQQAGRWLIVDHHSSVVPPPPK